MNKFDTKETTVKALTADKKPDCVIALTAEFEKGVSQGLTFRQAYYIASGQHFLNDHDGYNNLPELRDEYQTIEDIQDDLNKDIANPEYTDQATYLLRWFNFLSSSGLPVSLAFSIAAQASMEEYEDDNDFDEAEAIRRINTIPSEETKDDLLRRFYALRNEGNSVYASVRIAREEAEEEARMQSLFSLFSSFGGGEGLIN